MRISDLFDRCCNVCSDVYTPRVNASGKRTETCESDECKRIWREKRVVVIEMPILRQLEDQRIA